MVVVDDGGGVYVTILILSTCTVGDDVSAVLVEVTTSSLVSEEVDLKVHQLYVHSCPFHWMDTR